jgi:hypothetical protein
MNNNIIKIVLIGQLLIGLIAFFGCSEDGSIITPNNNNGSSTTTTTISGLVVNENNEPIAGATVSAHGHVKTTGANGEFMFVDITVPQNRLFVKAEKQGFYTATRGDQPKAGSTVMKLTMMPKSVTHTISSVSGGSADLNNGSKVEIQAGSVVKEDGSVYNGQVNMSVKYMDPTDVKFSETVAGGDMMARRTDSSDAVLYSYGILKVELEGPAGEKLNVTGSKPSTITTSIPTELVASAPATIPLWYFDENTGLWREEGVATKQGNKYVGTVNHFTDWNCDHPGYITSVKGKIVDCQGQPMPNVVVKIGQTTANTDVNGEYSRTVPTGVEFEVSVEATQNFGMSGAPISIPSLTQNQIYQVPLCQLACYPVLTGNFKDCNGNNIYGMVTMWWDNKVQGIMPTQMGSFRFYTAPNRQVRLKFTSYSGVVIDTTVQTPATPVVMNLGDLRSCGTTGGDCVNSFVITGLGYTNQQFVLQNGAFSIGVYSVKDSFTVVTAASMDSVNFGLAFYGQPRTGLFTESSGTVHIHGQYGTAAETITVRVTEYGAVGDHIKGTFEGTYMSASGPVQITNGKFCSIRQPDHIE